MTARTLTCHVESVEDLTPDVFRVRFAARPEALAHAPGQFAGTAAGQVQRGDDAVEGRAGGIRRRQQLERRLHGADAADTDVSRCAFERQTECEGIVHVVFNVKKNRMRQDMKHG